MKEAAFDPGLPPIDYEELEEVLRFCREKEAELAVEHDLRTFLLDKIARSAKKGQRIVGLGGFAPFEIRRDEPYRRMLLSALGPGFRIVANHVYILPRKQEES